MKKTEYIAMVATTYTEAIWRRVWEQDGRKFIKWQGQVIDITDNKKIEISRG